MSNAYCRGDVSSRTMRQSKRIGGCEMKNYENLKIVVRFFEEEDVVTTSDLGSGDWGQQDDFED